MGNSYKLANDKSLVGYKGVRLSNDNLASFPDRLLKIWHSAGIIKEVKQPKKSEKHDS